jgi:hypothetical protein
MFELQINRDSEANVLLYIIYIMRNYIKRIFPSFKAVPLWDMDY